MTSMIRIHPMIHCVWLAFAIGCSDDGVPGQGQNSSSSGGEEATGVATTGVTVAGSDTTPLGTSTAPDTDPGTGGSGTSDTNDGSDGTGPETTGDTTAGTGTGATEGTGTSEGTGTTGEPCVPITDDASAIGLACLVDLDCPDGYTCQPFIGFVAQDLCQILCEQTCECPVGLTCNETVDKTEVPWFQCG